MHIVELPEEFYDTPQVSSERPLEILESIVHVPESGTVYDFCWYPPMNSLAPETCCFLASRQHEPLHMWDGYNGSIRCSYRGYNYADEVEPALSVNFTPNGMRVLAGYKKSLKIFHTGVPGRYYSNYKTKAAVSTIAPFLNCDYIALGSWNSQISIIDPRTNDINVLTKLTGHTGGITMIKFTPNGEIMVTGSRKEDKLLCWDLRDLTTPLYDFQRTVETSQRIYFDVSRNGKWLMSGDTSGLVHIWDLERNEDKNNIPVLRVSSCC